MDFRKQPRRFNTTQRFPKLEPFWRAVVEVAFIIFLFYSNLLMGQYTISAPGQDKGIVWAIVNIFSIENFIIALVTAVIAHVVFEYLRKRL
jgi:predicted acetyltransferase